MFEIGDFYRHKKTVDSCFRVVDLKVYPKNYSLKITWYWLKDLHPMGVSEFVTVPIKDAADYHKVLLQN